MKTKTDFDELLEQELVDPEFARGFAEASHFCDLAQQIHDRRVQLGFSQKDLADRVGTTQQQISRLEQAGYRGSIRTLQRVAVALGMILEVRLNASPATRPKPRTAPPSTARFKPTADLKRSRGKALSKS